MSDMRRAARGLVETRSERFESRHTLEESQHRLQTALANAAATDARLTTKWETGNGRAALVAEFAPSQKTQRFLKALSIGMAMLLAASAWTMLSQEATGSIAFLLPMITVLAILGFPFVVLGLASQREAEEARIRKAIRVALLDEDSKLPAPKRWDDED